MFRGTGTAGEAHNILLNYFFRARIDPLTRTYPINLLNYFLDLVIRPCRVLHKWVQIRDLCKEFDELFLGHKLGRRLIHFSIHNTCFLSLKSTLLSMEQQLHKFMPYLASLYNLMHVTCQVAKLRNTQLTLATVRCKRTKIDLVIKMSSWMVMIYMK
jgi:hypothetical protein